MKKYIYLCISILSLSAQMDNIYCQEDTQNDGANLLINKKWAIQFLIDKNAVMTPFNGTTFSVLRKIDNKRAWRIGVLINSNARNNLNKAIRLSNDSLTSSQNSKRIDYDCQLSAQYILNTHVTNKISCYFGFGSAVLYKGLYQKYEFYGEYTNKTKVWGVGLSGVIGVEWQFHKQISLNAEYNSGLFYQNSNTLQKQIYSRYKASQNDFSFNSSPVRFGVTVYL
jgi:hypothetical protein